MSDGETRWHPLWCCRPDLASDKSSSHGLPTVTSDEQSKVEGVIHVQYQYYLNQKSFDEKELRLERDKHAAYLMKGLRKLSGSYECLDASRPWLVYWSVHALLLLEEELDLQLQRHIIDFLSRCQCPDGGFGGGPGQLAHLAPTYAAVNTLVSIGTQEAYAVIDRQKLANFLSEMVTEEGAFRMHDGGEVDIRGTYCAVAVARLTRIALHPLFTRTPLWIVQCQTYEGGFSGGPGLEAHGGYTYCGLAALAMLHSSHLADTNRLLRWVSGRQMRYSGGFQGRTNKLVDGCYSFWQGALFPVLHHIIAEGGSGVAPPEDQCWLFNCEALQNYLLVCCQATNGGLLDKPGKCPDFYHTCYTLSGLSVAQHFCYSNVKKLSVVGDPSNELALTHPLHNIVMTAVLAANEHFSQLPSVQPSVCTFAADSTSTAANGNAATAANGNAANGNAATAANGNAATAANGNAATAANGNAATSANSTASTGSNTHDASHDQLAFSVTGNTTTKVANTEKGEDRKSERDGGRSVAASQNIEATVQQSLHINDSNTLSNNRKNTLNNGSAAAAALDSID